jgi:predicted RecB family nuclease
MMTIPKLISKAKILKGYQCAKGFYLSIHHKGLEPKPDSQLLALFDQAHQVSEFARQSYSKKYPESVTVDNVPWDFTGALQKTKELLAVKSKVIFEAAFEYKGCFARVDMIIYNEQTERWHISDVKSTTKVKDEHLDDIGLQAWIIANAGLPLEKISILHINNLCTYPNLDDLFISVDVTEKLRELHPQIAARLNQFFPLLKSQDIPKIDIGRHCMKPNPCAFFDHCYSEKNIPEDSIFNIPTLNDKKWDLYEKGMIDIFDQRLLQTDDLNEKQKIFLDVLKTKKRFMNIPEIQNAITSWIFPLVFLDFETIAYAIPKYEGTRPFQQVPFQFSIHILNSIDDVVTQHFEYLDDKNFDPRLNLTKKLVEIFKKFPNNSSVVAYYSKFEAGCLQDLMDYFPEYAQDLGQIQKRLVDPLPIFRELVYDVQFKDSFSLKSVAPALLGDTASYGFLDISDGGAAQRAYLKLMNTKTAASEKALICQNLLQYCKKDTDVLVQLVQWLYKQK